MGCDFWVGKPGGGEKRVSAEHARGDKLEGDPAKVSGRNIPFVNDKVNAGEQGGSR